VGEFLEQARPSSPTPAQLGHSERALNKQLRDGRAGLDVDHVRNLDAICMRLTARLAVVDKNSHLAGVGHAAFGNAVTSKSERYYERGRGAGNSRLSNRYDHQLLQFSKYFPAARQEAR